MNTIEQFIIISKSLNGAIIIFSLIVFLDVLIRFKRPLNLKLIILSIIFAVLFSSFFQFIFDDKPAYFLIFAICKAIVIFELLNLFCFLYFFTLKKFIRFFTISAYISFFIIACYFHYNGIVFSYADGHGYLGEILPMSTDFMPLYFINVFRLIYTIILFSFLIYFIYQIVFKINYNNIYFKKIKNFTISILIFIVSLFFVLLIRSITKIDNILFNAFVLFYFRIFILLIFLYRPIFLNRSFATISLSNLFDIKQKIVNDSEFTINFYVHLYFINKNANIQDFAKISNVQVDDIKIYIKNIYGLSFDELIDKNRIEYFVQIIKDPIYNNLTIEALAEEVGYSSRSSFYKSFKRFHGGNPSDLISAYN